MNCPSCNSSLEPNARFCGVCGYRLLAGAQGAPAKQPVIRPQTPAPLNVQVGRSAQGSSAPPKRPIQKARAKGDEIYLNQVLNNRFKVESKIGEGGFGAVYRGVQLATGRKVALKLLHPEMTKDENLVARFRREGMVLCNLRDAHTITTYDFDQTPDGTLYIAMELLEGKSLHQIFHDEAPLEWKRVFKILTEMCSSLAEAHAQGIVHRDLKPENIYLESRPGNPEFVKILDFGIAKVMRGESIDPASPQLTATGQTLGTLEYMSPEQLMGKALDGRSDVYALGVVAYEMITGRLPFPDAKGPAGLITAQLKQTPPPPSQANPKASLPPAADRAILRCLEKDKNNRFADVTALAAELQDVIAQSTADLAAIAAGGSVRPSMADLAETRRSDAGGYLPPPSMPSGQSSHGMAPAPNSMTPVPHGSNGGPPPGYQTGNEYPRPGTGPNPAVPQGAYGLAPHPGGTNPGLTPGAYASAPSMPAAPPASSKWVWLVVALVVLGAAGGAVLAYFLKYR